MLDFGVGSLATQHNDIVIQCSCWEALGRSAAPVVDGKTLATKKHKL
jgi:hypothetical protein